uniref:Uncharacterized protein n=1 Tax=Glossina pallidipes TaxID=7398 RepID=A0A1B0A2S9_GLOPL
MKIHIDFHTSGKESKRSVLKNKKTNQQEQQQNSEKHIIGKKAINSGQAQAKRHTAIKRQSRPNY